MNIRKFIFILLAFLSLNTFAVDNLFNYLGTGSNPRLHLTLSKNSASWDSYSIDYQHSGGIPSKAGSNVWSTWDVKDEKNNYYGTITLESDGITTSWGTYSAGDGGRHLDGLRFSPIEGTTNYQLTVKKISGAGDEPDPEAGPFPEAPVAIPAMYPGTTIPVVLSVSGDNIVNNMGYPLRLKGMVRPSLEWSKQGQYLSSKDIQAMVTWGANVVRVNMNKRFWLDSKPVSVKGSYRQIINAIIHYAIQNNMAVILDLHWTSDEGRVGQSPMASKDSVEFWTQVATEYKNFGTVIFELFNEPVYIPKEIWLNGGAYQGAEFAGYQQMYDAVRRTGAQNICIINGLDWGYDLSFVNREFGVQGTNIVYGSHPYVDKGRSNWAGAGGSFDNNFKGVIGKYPIIFTEFGDNVPSDYLNGKYREVYPRIIEYIAAKKIHYTGFAWWVENNNPAFPALISDWNGTATNGGLYVKKDMQDVPGTPINIRLLSKP